ncbi:MAG: leucine-rich repeat protein [Clostridiales bacterium]|nr:leucine-rich repeat protein [Clostridiales bacterium]
MSIDFGGSCSGRVNKETMAKLSGLKNILFESDCWYDNKCDIIDGFARESVSFETRDRFYNYVLDNSLFSGFVSSDRVDVGDKETCAKKSFKLAVQATTCEHDLFHNISDRWVLLSELNYEHLENYSDDYGYSEDKDPVEVMIPQLWIPKNYDPDKENRFIIEATINKEEYYIVFGMDSNGMNNIGYYNRQSGEFTTYILSDVSEEEYLLALKNAEDALSKPYDYNNTGIYGFPTKIFLNFKSVEMPAAKFEDQKDHTPNGQYQAQNEDLSKLTMPVIPKLPLAEYKDGTLTFNGPYDHISKYLVRLTLHSLGITSDNDLNNYYYEDDKLLELKLKLVIPGTIRYIDHGAFFNKPFVSIVMEDGVAEIRASSFRNARARSITLPDTLTHIGEKAFAENNISAIFIPKNVCSIAGNAFSECNRLKKISVDDSNEYYRAGPDHKSLIENAPSRLVVALDGAVIPEGVKIIGERSFSWLRDTGELIIPSGVEIIEDGAFSTCYYTNIVFPDTLLEIGDHVFWQCHNLKKLIFPKSLKHIGEYSFTLSSLEEVIIHADTKIGKGSFDSITDWCLDSSNLIRKGTRAARTNLSLNSLF